MTVSTLSRIANDFPENEGEGTVAGKRKRGKTQTKGPRPSHPVPRRPSHTRTLDGLLDVNKDFERIVAKYDSTAPEGELGALSPLIVNRVQDKLEQLLDGTTRTPWRDAREIDEIALELGKQAFGRVTGTTVEEATESDWQTFYANPEVFPIVTSRKKTFPAYSKAPETCPRSRRDAELALTAAGNWLLSQAFPSMRRQLDSGLQGLLPPEKRRHAELHNYLAVRAEELTDFLDGYLRDPNIFIHGKTQAPSDRASNGIDASATAPVPSGAPVSIGV